MAVGRDTYFIGANGALGSGSRGIVPHGFACSEDSREDVSRLCWSEFDGGSRVRSRGTRAVERSHGER